MLKIRLYGDAVLREKTGPVEKVTAAVRRLTIEMIEAMFKYVGVGLAAPQVGKNLRLAVLHHPELHPKPLILINPEILDRGDELVSIEEGCLSLPRLNVAVARPKDIRIRFTDVKGKLVIREFSDLMARIIQHECDHLDGKLIVDHMDLQSRLRFETAFKQTRKHPPSSS